MKERRQPEWAINIAPDLDKPESINVSVRHGDNSIKIVRLNLPVALGAAKDGYNLLSDFGRPEDEEASEDEPEPEPAEGAQEAVDLGNGREVPGCSARMPELPERSWIGGTSNGHDRSELPS